MKKITLGFSPCPNDTFIFDALVNKKIDTGDLEFETVLEDVQTLNLLALEGRLDFSKISYGVLPLVVPEYVLLNSGGALGKGVGPLLITLPGAFKGQLVRDEIISFINTASVAIPGVNTTAHMLFSLAFPVATNKVFKIFNEIEDAIVNKTVDAGVIIHENRFTYRQKGLIKLMDLGEYWESETGLPIPLGGIVARKSLNKGLIDVVDMLIYKSIQYAYINHYKQLSTYVKQHAQEMSESIMRQHIDLYVNNYSLDLGEEGKKAVKKLTDVFRQLNKDDD